MPNVNFLGHLSGEALGRAVASADILINPSQSEAFGNVNLEAMASGLAVVSADVPSASQLIDHGRNGLLVAPDDIDAYVAAVLRLVNDAALSKAVRGAAAQAGGQHCWPDVLDVVLNAYRMVLGRS
jgi:glycosyltransferase involved in cell wall biosynthesis